MRIMVRHAESDFDVLKISNAMESVGAVVFAITNDGTSTYQGALAPHNRFQVWAKITSDDMCDVVDAAVEKEYES